MEITLRGSIPGATTAGILLLTRARQLGLPIQVSVIRNPNDVERLPGPAILYAPVLASCGVGREAGAGGLVVVPGDPNAPLMITATPHGLDGWFFVDRCGNGYHEASKAFVRLTRDPRVKAKQLAKQLRKAMDLLGMSSDPAVLDVLFGAKVPPLTRLSLALRAGRALSGKRGEPITRFATGSIHDAFPPIDADDVTVNPQEHGWILDGFSPAVRDQIEEWVKNALQLAQEDNGRDLPLLNQLAELASYLVQLPSYSILPPLGAAEDSVSAGLNAGLSHREAGDALEQLTSTFRFLGGRYVDDAPHAYDVCDAPAPSDHIERWQWFCDQVRDGRKRATILWPMITDPAH